MLRLWLMVCVCLGLLAFGPAPVVASADPPHKEGDAAKEGAKEAGKDTGHKTDDKAGGHAAPHAEGPPDIFKWSIDLTIWTMVVFLLLLLILWRFAWKPILEALQGREKGIADAVEQARKDRDEAAALRQQLQTEMNNVAEKVRAMLEEGRRDVQHQRDEILAAARAEVQTEKERLRREIDTARDQALQDIWNKTVELATALSSTTVRRRLTPEDHRALVDEALNELGPAAAEWRRRGGQSA
jgi:F-type H+-transporting ATPase subunit b